MICDHETGIAHESASTYFQRGPLVFTMYAHPLEITAQQCAIKYYLYANDSQLNKSLDLHNEVSFSSWLKI